MSVICNKRQDTKKRPPSNVGIGNVYLENESYVESGSAYFAQAFAESICLLSDLELHDPGRASLRLKATDFLLASAQKQYESALASGSTTGLNKYHEDMLRRAGLDFEKACRVLIEARRLGFLQADDQQIETLASTFNHVGYVGLMNLYMGKVREIRDLIAQQEEPGHNAVEWQELGWKLTTLFIEAIKVGKAIAILNTLTFRLSGNAKPQTTQSEYLEVNPQ